MSQSKGNAQPKSLDGLKLKTPTLTYEQTLRRLEKIQNHLSRPRGQRLQGKVCVVTGVGSLKGIGRATSLLFAHEGARALYLLDFDGTNLPNLKETINAAYPDVQVEVTEGDAADETTISTIVSNAVQSHGGIDVFFANAGVASGQPSILDLSAEEWEEMMRINTTSCFLAVKYAAPAMMKPKGTGADTGGSIIMTASVAGLRSGAGPAHYSASKAAVNNLAQSASWQLRHSNIRVNSICPGLIETGMTAAVFEMARQRGTANKIGQLNPMGRNGVAEEVANVALFLASDESSYVNGQNIAVDGGLSASLPVMPGKIA